MTYPYADVYPLFEAFDENGSMPFNILEFAILEKVVRANSNELVTTDAGIVIDSLLTRYTSEHQDSNDKTERLYRSVDIILRVWHRTGTNLGTTRLFLYKKDNEFVLAYPEEYE